MRPDGDLGFSPGQQDIGMVSLLFGDGSHPVHERKGLLKIRELEYAMDVVLVDDLPVGKPVAKGMEWGAFEGRHIAFAGNAGLAGQVSHGEIPIDSIPAYPERGLGTPEKVNLAKQGSNFFGQGPING
jgi:hypothetical protein